MTGKKRLLILGSDYGTLDTVIEAHRMGLYVIVTDNMPTSPTKEAADEAWNISTADIDALVGKCIAKGIAGVTYGASDFNATNARKLCKRLGLPHCCDNDAAWECACNKSVFKSTCKSVGAPVATDYFLSDSLNREELDKIRYPVVVKPVDKSGNEGVSFCDNEAELIKAYKAARAISDNPVIIVERQLHGPVFSANYVLCNGEARLLCFGALHNQSGYPHNIYSMIDTTSYHLKQYLETVNQKVIDVFKAAGLTNGIAWAEAMLDQDGRFYLIEMAHRYGGGMIYAPYKEINGFNSIRYMIEIAMGVSHTSDDMPEALDGARTQIAASYFLFTTKATTIDSIVGLENIVRQPNITIDVPKKTHCKTRYRSTMGVMRIVAKDADELCRTIEFINSHFKVTDSDGNNIIVYFDDFETLKTEYVSGLYEFGTVADSPRLC
ncbi:acetyl-CoA carboxylase biotin carboxylase subunit family protein [Parabacteroides sp. ZJ-118]|uniref:ATP-grasp domain-containing protein n=1 Tax=Parabacteroides sp. ZJ-118 TaxID=2709398 RepID=UPI0013EA0161|nr:ATP-grasp domain-containing protein [Parabacteroides sp. ZJ-118]